MKGEESFKKVCVAVLAGLKGVFTIKPEGIHDQSDY